MAGFFGKLKEGLASAFTASTIDENFYETLEELMIMGDMGVATTEDTLDELRSEVAKRHVKTCADCKDLLKEILKDKMRVPEDSYDFEQHKAVVLVVGVNGVGKTTTVGKLAAKYKSEGRKVIMGACDTFRAAAGEQLSVWAERAGVEIVSGQEGSDPSSVLYNAIGAAKGRNADILLCDTAGRLHNKKNLMDELGKMHRVIEREMPDASRENLLVLDATTGQNAMQQAREFSEVADLTGIILTKLDGSAKGGVAISIQAELHIPVKYIGVGEKIDDLQRFDADSFIEELFD